MSAEGNIGKVKITVKLNHQAINALVMYGIACPGVYRNPTPKNLVDFLTGSVYDNDPYGSIKLTEEDILQSLERLKEKGLVEEYEEKDKDDCLFGEKRLKTGEIKIDIS